MKADKKDTDPLLRSSVYRIQLGNISPVTEWRWVKKGILPPPIKINKRNYQPQSVIERVKRGEV